MILKITTAVIALLAGGWMLFDGLHVLLRGRYFGPEKPGPWSVPFARLGMDALRLGPLFVVLGLLWLAFLAALLSGRSWGWYGAVATAVATLWYLPLGTVLSLAYLALLFFGNPRAGAVP
jgi:hypothetical protein